jgi:hypothetical protein
VKVIVYVEGPSDQRAMQALLADLLVRLQVTGVAVEFIPAENKKRLILQTPGKAVNILLNDPKAVVVALPDLYPPNIGFKHTTFEELTRVLQEEFSKTLARKKSDDVRLYERFHVHCFKHDLEALILASESQLALRLGVNSLPLTWVKPVEDQDHHKPPKRIVEELFQNYGHKYKDTVDAPLILSTVQYSEVAAACPQCFQPFVAYLESLLG